MENNTRIKIIAEVAQGYEGSFEQAKLLLRAAVNAGADAIKFQVIYADELCTEDYEYRGLFQNLEMEDGSWHELVRIAHQESMEMHFDIFGPKSLELAIKNKVDAVKVHATDLENMGLMRLIKSSAINTVYLGVGGAFSAEIRKAVEMLESKICQQAILCL